MSITTAHMTNRRRILVALGTVLLGTLLAACGGGSGGAAAPTNPPLAPLGPGATLPTSRINAATPMPADCGAAGAGATLYLNAEVEPYLARSAQNADHWVAVWQQDRYSDGAARAVASAASFDGGRTWLQTVHPFSRCGGAVAGSSVDFDRASDPWVEIGNDGTVHVMALAVSGTSFTSNSRSAMLASRSTDGGRSYSAPQVLAQDSGAGFFHDKNTLTVDPTDARFVYAVWDRLEANGNGPTVLARSVNAGQSWESVRTVYRLVAPGNGTAQTIGNRIVVPTAGASAGTLVMVFTEIVTNGNSTTNTVRVLRSSDRGLSWGAPITVGELRAVGARNPTTGTPVRDGSILPSVAAAPDGTLWVAWQDSRFSGGQRDAIALSRSSDGGLTWSAPVAANRDLRVAAFTPTLSVRADGLLGLAYFDLRPDTAETSTLLTAAWLVSTRDGAAFAETPLWPAFDLAQAPNARGLFVGDYQGMVAVGNDFVPLLALSGADPTNRTDVYTLRTTPNTAAAALRHDNPPLTGDQVQALQAHLTRSTITANTRAFMDRRVPGWSQRVGLTDAVKDQR